MCFSIDKVSKVASPVLVIHGTEDEVIDFSHGLAIYERCPRAVEPLWVEGAGHNDIELYAQYLERLKQFITFELATSWRRGAERQAEARTHSRVSCRVPLYPGLRTHAISTCTWAEVSLLIFRSGAFSSLRGKCVLMISNHFLFFYTWWINIDILHRIQYVAFDSLIFLLMFFYAPQGLIKLHFWCAGVFRLLYFSFWLSFFGGNCHSIPLYYVD